MYRNQNGSDSDSQSDNEDFTKSRRKEKSSEGECSGEENMDNEEPSVRRKRKGGHVWTDVAVEQSLTENMTQGFGVQEMPEDIQDDRGVESYNFTVARFDTRPDIAPINIEGVPEKLIELRKQEQEKAARVKERLGQKDETAERLKSVPKVYKLDESSPPETVCMEILKRLKESKRDLILRVVDVIGVKLSIEILAATETIEMHGGLMINRGTRRRTPGGVFLHLVRSDRRISQQDLSRIFDADDDRRKELVKRKKRTQMEKRAAKIIKTLEAQLLGEASTSSSSSGEEQKDHVMIEKEKMEVIPEVNIPRRSDSDLEEGEVE